MKTIDDYEVLREIGRGGMGVVVHARRRDGSEVAIKLLQNLSKESLLQRFQREERLQTLLSGKDGFVPLLASGECAEGPYLVMPYLSGGTLRDRLQKGMLDLEAALVLLHALGLALGKAHDAGIVHRDMKPDNVIFDGTGKPYIADLGLAKHFRRDLPGGSKSINVTKTGQALGTTGYMAIEQMRDAQNAGPPADVFALGAILYECLMGRCPPYIGRQSLTKTRPDLPEWISVVVERSLARDPADRYPDGTAFARALAHAETRLALLPPILAQTVPMAALVETETRATFLDHVPEDSKVDAPPSGATAADPAPAASAVELVSQVPEPPRPSPPASLATTVKLDPEPAKARSLAWLWILALVAFGVIAGVVADRLLR